MKYINMNVHEKNGFEVSQNIAEYRFKNNYVWPFE